MANGTTNVVACEVSADEVEDKLGVVFGEPSVVVDWFGLEV